VKDDKILLTRQWDGYSLVGGGVDKGETLEEVFVREAKEETGLDASPDKMIFHTMTFFKKDDESQPKQSFQFYFTHKNVEGVVNNDGITMSEGDYTNDVAEWVSLDDAQHITLRHSVSMDRIIQAYKDNLAK